MPAYWWKCEACGQTADFSQVCASKGMAHFIWDEMVPSNWNQDRLLRVCPHCKANAMRITYEFPRQDKIELALIHAVGLDPTDGSYIPMVWEAAPAGYGSERWFDF